MTTESEGSASADPTGDLRVLFVYFTYSQQARRVTEAMTDALQAEGCGITEAVIEFTDPRYAPRFAVFPMRHAFRDLLRLLPAQLRRATGEIKIPDAAAKGGYDLVDHRLTHVVADHLDAGPLLPRVIRGRRAARRDAVRGFVVCRRYWGNNMRTVKRLGTERGGRYLDGLRFAYAGGQVRSLLSLISYLGSGEYRDRYLGVRIPPTNLKPDFEEEAATFARRVAASVKQSSTSGAHRPGEAQ